MFILGAKKKMKYFAHVHEKRNFIIGDFTLHRKPAPIKKGGGEGKESSLISIKMILANFFFVMKEVCFQNP